MNHSYPNAAVHNSLSRISILQFPFPSLRRIRKIRNPKLLFRSNSSFSAAKSNCGSVIVANNGGDGYRDSEECRDCVEVIVVGSRKDALLSFCSGSPFLSPALRFWNILGYDSDQVLLQQRLASQDNSPITVEDFSAGQSSCKAVILVAASAAYGSDHITALEVLSNVKSGNGFVVGIILKPFRFEGQRRKDEVKDLVGKLQKEANFCLVLDTDTLLENDMVTLDEALRTSNSAVLMAMNAISILLSEKHIKLLNTKDKTTRELQLPEFKEILEIYNEGRIGFGDGYNVKTSLLRAIKECPFLGLDFKDFDGVLLCIITSSGVVDSSDAANILHTVRVITKCNCEVIVSIVREPNLEPKTISATIVALGCVRQQVAPRSGIFSSLGQHFPFFFNIFKKQNQQTDYSGTASSSESPYFSNTTNPTLNGDMPNATSLDGTTEESGVFSGKFQPLSEDTDEDFYSLSDDSSFGERDAELLDDYSITPSYDLKSDGTAIFERELVTRGNLGPGHSTESSKYGINFSEAIAPVDNVSVYKLPVGVKHLEKFEETNVTSNTKHRVASRVDGSGKQQNAVPSVSWLGLSDVNFSNNVSLFNKGNYTGNSKKQGVLSTRAASMLDSERDSQKKWNRVVEMKYRGGIYKGRAQGGLPEGKGRLLLGDGSIYDGMWRYGKRSGMGTFYFKNGDVFQGSWRDDVMHGKGWIYFHNGDRWFANFWKGKANGEGRFYSKLGDVFFGHFKEGWRHGNFLRINIDGTRSQELWDEGMLISEKQLDPDAEVG